MADRDEGAGDRPLRAGNRLTTTEAHATVLGLVVGAVAAFALDSGFREAAVSLGSTFVGVALGFELRGRVDPAERALRREPWYALGGFAVAGVAVLAL